ncbi:hypothetical protein F4677DRAFT_448991 [Hypoxylon crocopeplum]|nr:hypothetical protein F4677DRAFT_448991 [Hypoxylon crocopeplum]
MAYDPNNPYSYRLPYNEGSMEPSYSNGYSQQSSIPASSLEAAIYFRQARHASQSSPALAPIPATSHDANYYRGVNDYVIPQGTTTYLGETPCIHTARSGMASGGRETLRGDELRERLADISQVGDAIEVITREQFRYAENARCQITTRIVHVDFDDQGVWSDRKGIFWDTCRKRAQTMQVEIFVPDFPYRGSTWSETSKRFRDIAIRTLDLLKYGERSYWYDGSTALPPGIPLRADSELFHASFEFLCGDYRIKHVPSLGFNCVYLPLRKTNPVQLVRHLIDNPAARDYFREWAHTWGIELAW